MTAITAKKLEKTIEKSLLEWLAPLEFCAEDGGGCARWREGIYIYIGCVVTRVGGINRVKPFGQMGFKSTQQIYQAFMHDKTLPSPDRSVDLQADYSDFMRNWNADMRCQNMEELDDFLEKLRVFILNTLYPTLNAFTDPRQVLELYLKKNEKDSANFDLPSWGGASSALTGLILARLHAPEHYSALKERYQPIFEPLYPERKERVMKLIAYLDQDVLPSLS